LLARAPESRCPVFLRYSVHRPESAYDSGGDSVQVEYVEPQIPQPTAATHVQWARARRQYEASVHSYHRSIAGGDRGLHSQGPLWLQNGDSMAIRVSELHCSHDVCTETHPTPTDSGWSVSDPTVARLQAPDTSARRRMYLRIGSRYVVKALRPGRVVLAVRGVHSVSDTAVSSTQPERNLERELVVTQPVGSVRFLRKPDTVRVKQPFTLDIRAFDVEGRALAEVPIEFSYTERGIDHAGTAIPNMQIRLEAPGTTRLVARVRQLADTVTVVVVDSSATPAPR